MRPSRPSRAGDSGSSPTASPPNGKGLPDALASILRKPEGERSDDEKKTLDAGLRKHFDDKVRPTLTAKLPALSKSDVVRKQLKDYRGDQLPRVMIMSDARPRETAILTRGEYLKPGRRSRSRPRRSCRPMPEGAPANRLGLARWLVMPEHPLTARVQVNRMWQHAFGTGIVKTARGFRRPERISRSTASSSTGWPSSSASGAGA